MKYASWSWLAVMGLLAGCVIPKIINHPKPELKVDFSPFEDVGCLADEYGTRLCEPDSALYALGCDRIDKPPDLMGGLAPDYPMAVCIYMPYYRPDVVDPFKIPQSEYFYNIGGPMPELVRYVIFKDGNFLLIKNSDEFRAVFAPVDNASEALSIALVMMDVYPQYDLKFDIRYRYEVETLEDTFVETTGDGYMVHAFDYQFFGCGPHYYYAVELMVTTDGRVQENSRTKIYRDPLKDGLCQD
jgi:hypothetical protein